MTGTSTSGELTIDRFYLSVRLKSLFFPIELEPLVSLLQEFEYTIVPELKAALTQLPSGVRLDIAGPIASLKIRDIQVRLNVGQGIVTVQGREISGVAEEYTRIADAVFRKLGVDLKEESRFYESIVEGEIFVGKDRNPVVSVGKLFSDSKQMQAFSKVLGKPFANFGIRLVEKDATPDAEVWEEIKIEPLVSKPKTTYYVNIVSRRNDLGSLIERSMKIPALTKGVLAIIESQVQ